MVENQSALAQMMMNQYGPILRGRELHNALGFDSAQSFLRAKRLKQLQVNVFPLPGRRGYFALTMDVAGWLEKCGRDAASTDTGLQIKEGQQ